MSALKSKQGEDRPTNGQVPERLDGIIASVSEEDEAERRKKAKAEAAALKDGQPSKLSSFFQIVFCCICPSKNDLPPPMPHGRMNLPPPAIRNEADFEPDNNPITSVAPNGAPASIPRPPARGELAIPASNGAAVSNGSVNGSANSALVQAPKKYLLKPLLPEDAGKKCLVLDLDETLVHSCFKPVAQADFVVPVEIENQIHNVYVTKRPGVDQFMKKMGESFEVVVFTASLAKYADPVLDMLDKHKVVRHRLFREACVNHKGNYVKDLSLLGRELRKVIIIDNSPASYIFHPENALPISSWFSDQSDTELLDLIPFLMDLTKVDDVCTVLDQTQDERKWNNHRK